jgi:hypothetical protein
MLPPFIFFDEGGRCVCLDRPAVSMVSMHSFAGMLRLPLLCSCHDPPQAKQKTACCTFTWQLAVCRRPFSFPSPDRSGFGLIMTLLLDHIDSTTIEIDCQQKSIDFIAFFSWIY